MCGEIIKMSHIASTFCDKLLQMSNCLLENIFKMYLKQSYLHSKYLTVGRKFGYGHYKIL